MIALSVHVIISQIFLVGQWSVNHKTLENKILTDPDVQCCLGHDFPCMIWMRKIKTKSEGKTPQQCLRVRVYLNSSFCFATDSKAIVHV